MLLSILFLANLAAVMGGTLMSGLHYPHFDEMDEKDSFIIEQRKIVNSQFFGTEIFNKDRQNILNILKVPKPIWRPDLIDDDGKLYGFQDKKLFRTLTREYKPLPHKDGDVEILFDLKKYNDENPGGWEWVGFFVPPRTNVDRALISLRGNDEHRVFELDLVNQEERKKDDEKFYLSLSKTDGLNADYINEDTILFYANIKYESEDPHNANANVKYKPEDPHNANMYNARVWRRNTKSPLANSQTLLTLDASKQQRLVFEIDDFECLWLVTISWDDEPTVGYFVQSEEGKDPKLISGPPTHISRLHLAGRWVLFELVSPWYDHKAGTLLAFDREDVIDGSMKNPQTIFEPVEHKYGLGGEYLQAAYPTKDHLILRLTSNGRIQLRTLALKDIGSDVVPKTMDFTANGIKVSEAIDPQVTYSDSSSKKFLVTVRSYETPNMLLRGDFANIGQQVKLEEVVSPLRGPQRFIQRYTVTSKDDTRIHYIVDRPSGKTGPGPTILQAYGGFGDIEGPGFDSQRSAVWPEVTFVYAQVRGDGYNGPGGHEDGKGNGRLKAIDDCGAVAKELWVKGFTEPSQLAFEGISGGGILAGGMLDRFPELFGAILIERGLADLQRVGDNWGDETGTWPENEAFSPLHQVKAGKKYPPIMILGSSNDKVVSPVHPRLITKRLRDMGYAPGITESGHLKGVWYLEAEGGDHNGPKGPEPKADEAAAKWSFLKSTIGFGV